MKQLLAFFLVLIVGILIGNFLNVGRYLSDNEGENNPPAEPNNSEKTPFHLDKEGNYYGAVTVTGYAQKEEVSEPFCEENCQKYQYVFFTILESDNGALSDFIGVNDGNSFVNKGVGIGCDVNGIIEYSNDSDALGMTDYKLAPDLSAKVLNSTREIPVTIELERLLYTSGRGAPACYSHFTSIRSPS